jgi:hypothetical protein
MADNIYQALDAARAEFPTIVKNRTNPHFKSKYADLQAILEAVEPKLREHGLGLFQHTRTGDLETELVLLSDPTQRLGCWTEVGTGLDPQKMGSAITYARRYGIVTLLGLVTEDDDDANATTPEPAPRQKPRRGPSEAAGGPVDPSGGWDTPQERAAAHEGLVEKIRDLEPEQQDELRKLSVTLGGLPLPKDKFQELERAVDLVGGTI